MRISDWSSDVCSSDLLLAILALYGVPLLLFARRLRGAGRCSASAPCAGVLFVATFPLCGLTQSMFAHQLSASFYAVRVGLLAGFCMTRRVGAQSGRASRGERVCQSV